MEALFSAAEAARLARMSERNVRDYVRAGLVGSAEGERSPAKKVGQSSFNFRDVRVLKAAAELIATGVPGGRVRRALARLRDQLPADKALCAASLELEGGRLIAHESGASWEPESGQCCFSFEARDAELVERAEQSSEFALGENVLAAIDSVGNLDAGDYWFDVAMSFEESDQQRSYEAYLRALACNPEHLEATINIGRLCSTAGDLQRAAAYFRQAVRLDHAHPVAQFNLAVTLHDLDELDTAAEAYRAALAADAEFADAHFNLAALLEQLGDREGALRHLSEYERSTRVR